jgi:MinD-like ATPase involved in chromosome partitioning or flagellar assembly
MTGLVALHSYKGGTGKTSICANLAVLLAQRGRSVCLLDFDFRAPSLQTLFKAQTERWLNDYLDGKCELENCFVDFSKKLNTKGTLKIGFANPSLNAIREMMTKDRKWEIKALHRSLSLKTLLAGKLGANYAIVDTSPGVHFSSMNAMAAADLIILVTKMDDFDTAGTKELIEGLYDVLGKRTTILVNRIANELTTGQKRVDAMKELTKFSKLPVLGMIPCFCDQGDHELSGGRLIYAVEKPEHDFTKILGALADDVERHLTPSGGPSSS